VKKRRRSPLLHSSSSSPNFFLYSENNPLNGPFSDPSVYAPRTTPKRWLLSESLKTGFATVLNYSSSSSSSHSHIHNSILREQPRTELIDLDLMHHHAASMQNVRISVLSQQKGAPLPVLPVATAVDQIRLLQRRLASNGLVDTDAKPENLGLFPDGTAPIF